MPNRIPRHSSCDHYPRSGRVSAACRAVCTSAPSGRAIWPASFPQQAAIIAVSPVQAPSGALGARYRCWFLRPPSAPDGLLVCGRQVERVQ